MQINEYKKYHPVVFVAICGILTVLAVGYFVYLYMSWQSTNQKNTAEIIEIRLPVMNWSQYSILSKKYEDDTVNRDK